VVLMPASRVEPCSEPRPGGADAKCAATPSVVGFLPLPSLAAFLDQQPNDYQRGRRINPPCAECHLRQKPDQHDKG
jgi:hypothetical protein